MRCPLAIVRERSRAMSETAYPTWSGVPLASLVSRSMTGWPKRPCVSKSRGGKGMASFLRRAVVFPNFIIAALLHGSSWFVESLHESRRGAGIDHRDVGFQRVCPKVEDDVGLKLFLCMFDG